MQLAAAAQGRRFDCRVLSCSPAVTVTGYKDVARLDEDALQDAVAQQPVVAAIAASHPVFMVSQQSGISYSRHSFLAMLFVSKLEVSALLI